MGIRDEEIKRLVKYAEGLGLRVSWRKDKPNNPAGAEWVVDEKLIIIYHNKGESKTNLILKLIHEIAHEREYIASKRTHRKMVMDALGRDIPTKKDRQVIFEDEKRAAAFHEIIATDCEIKIPLYKIQVERDLILAIYAQMIETPLGMKRIEQREIHRKLVDKYKPLV